MNNKLWGVTTWAFLHVLVAKMKDSSVPYIKHIIIHIITIICNSLPCPICREHATTTLQNNRHFHKLTTKEQFKQWLFNFHNQVNTKINKSSLPYSCLDQYETCNLREQYNIWNKHFVIINRDLQVFINKQQIYRTKLVVFHLLRVHQKHFT